jgi:hypothetical protein
VPPMKINIEISLETILWIVLIGSAILAAHR